MKYLLFWAFWGFYPLLAAGQSYPENLRHCIAYNRTEPVKQTFVINPCETAIIPVSPGNYQGIMIIIGQSGEQIPFEVSLCGAGSSFGVCKEPAFIAKHGKYTRDSGISFYMPKYYFEKGEKDFVIAVKNYGRDRMFANVTYCFMYCPVKNGK